MKIEDIENRFLEITGLNLDLSNPNLAEDNSSNQQQKTTKDKSKEFGQVFTPLWLCDKMINLEIDNIDLSKHTCDLCAGCGQFTIRLLRKLYTKYSNMDIDNWLKTKHTFTELQAISCAKLLYIFGKNITLYAGDSLKINTADDTDSGVLFFNPSTNKWENNQDFEKFLNSKYSDNINMTAAIIDRVYKYYEKLTPISKKKSKC